MQIRGQYRDFFDSTMLPALRGTIFEQHKAKPTFYDKLFKVVDGGKGSIVQYSRMSGVGTFSELGEGDDIQTDKPVQEYNVTFRHKRFGLAIEFSKDMVEDDQFGIIKENTQALVDAERETIEIDAASTFNRAFNASYAGGDGVALCSASHPLAKVGGVQSNILSVAADLDQDSLELALIDWETMKRSNGHQMSLPTPRLLVATHNRFRAFEMVKASMRSDTANNTPNSLQYAENGALNQVMVWSKLTDPDAWFLVAPSANTGLLWHWRMKPYTGSFFDDRSERGGVTRRYRKSHGFRDYVGVYGTPGA